MKLPNNSLKRGIGAAIILLLIATGACKNFYKVADQSNITAVTSDVTSPNPARYFILRAGANAYYMNNIVLSQDRKSLTCRLENLPDEHKLHLRNGRGGNMRYKKNEPEANVLNEVHLYIPLDTAAKAGKNYFLSLSKVHKVEVLEKDQGRTKASYVLGGVAIAAGAYLVTAVIIAALKSSCPFVSAYDGKNMVLQGEIYGGAIYPQLARNDYMALKMAPAPNGNLQLQISNELKERQYTDLAELMVVTHDKNVQMLVDENGRLYSVSNPTPPLTATVAGNDMLPLLRSENDDKFYSFDDTLAETGVNQLHLTFNKPVNAKRAKLILRLKNSYWLDLTYGRMTVGFGSYYNAFIKQQYTKPVAELKKWAKEQHMPLHVELNTNNGWRDAADITTFGPLATRETVVPLDLTNVTGNAINVQLSTGFMFWDIDYAAIDFSDDAPYEVSTLMPLKATDETGKDVLELVNKADGKYLEQPVPGNAAIIEYSFNPETGQRKTQTFILHAKGYYEHVRDYKGAPDLKFLEQFKKPGALSAYSMKLYKETLKGDVQTALAAN
jgi:hypothetical protein